MSERKRETGFTVTHVLVVMRMESQKEEKKMRERGVKLQTGYRTGRQSGILAMYVALESGLVIFDP